MSADKELWRQGQVQEITRAAWTGPIEDGAQTEIGVLTDGRITVQITAPDGNWMRVFWTADQAGEVLEALVRALRRAAQVVR